MVIYHDRYKKQWVRKKRATMKDETIEAVAHRLQDFWAIPHVMLKLFAVCVIDAYQQTDEYKSFFKPIELTTDDAAAGSATTAK